MTGREGNWVNRGSAPEEGVSKELYDKAIADIKATFLKGNPRDEQFAHNNSFAAAAHAQMDADLARHADRSFMLMFDSALRLHSDHLRFKSAQQPQPDPLAERVAKLPPELRAEFEKHRMKASAMLDQHTEDRQKTMEDHHRDTLVTTLQSAGMEKDTAERIVNEHILIHK